MNFPGKIREKIKQLLKVKIRGVHIDPIACNKKILLLNSTILVKLLLLSVNNYEFRRKIL
jgi:hypothetical protein